MDFTEKGFYSFCKPVEPDLKHTVPMYEAFYQLSAYPFRLSPDPEFSFQHRSYRKAMTYMLHALQLAEGFIMITGQPGTGKTTLVSDLVSTLRADQIAVATIVSAQLTANDLLDLVAYSFNLDPEGCSKAKVLFQVEDFLKQEYQQGLLRVSRLLLHSRQTRTLRTSLRRTSKNQLAWNACRCISRMYLISQW